MQRRVIYIAGAAIAVVAAALVLRDLGRHQAGKVVDKDINQALATLPPGYSATHGPAEVNPLTGTVTLRNVGLSYQGRLLWQADTVTVAGADQDALNKVFDPAAYPAGRPVSTASHALVEDFTASGLHVPDPRDPAAVVEIRSVALHGLKGRQFFVAPVQDQLKTKPFAADALLAFSVQSLDVRDIAIHNEKQATAVTLGSFTLRDYAGGKLGRAAIGDFSLEGNNEKPRPVHIHGALQIAELKSIDLGGVLLAVRDNKPFTPATSATQGGGTFHLAGFSFDAAPGPAITLTSADVSSVPAESSGLRTGKAALTGLTFALKDTPVGASADALIQAFGMKSITMDISAVSATDAPANHTKVEEDIDLHDLGTLHLKVSAGVANPADAQKDPRAALMKATIDRGELDWVDKGLVNRVFSAAAAQMHVSADMLRAQLAIPLVTLGFYLPDQPDAVDQITAFLNHPGTLSVTFNPPAPFTLAEVAALPVDQRARAMGVHIQGK